MKPLLVLRPEPGNKATVERALAMGLKAVGCPLFAVEAVKWTAPGPRADFILFTSANALRHGGEQLADLTSLDALAVGPATAEAASAVGFRVVMTGDEGVDKLLGGLTGVQRLLHLAGAEHCLASTRHAVETVVVYQSAPLPAVIIPTGKLVAMVHSPRAGARFAEMTRDRANISIAAISAPAAAACGAGWAALEVADQPNDRALLALAARLCQD